MTEDEGIFTSSTLAAREQRTETLQKLEEKKKAKQLVLPTKDSLVMLRLRELGEPITLFGEPPDLRRERLRAALVAIGSEQGMPTQAEEKTQFVDNELYYSKGSETLQHIRQWILHTSLKLAKQRVREQQFIHDNELSQRMDDELQKTCKRANNFSKISSVFGDDRPLGTISVSGDGKHIVTGAWSGICALWDPKTAEKRTILRGHTDRVHGSTFHPYCGKISDNVCNFATSSNDETVKLWSLTKETPLHTLTGHHSRVNKIAFHPSGRLLGTASHSQTWILWDVETGTLLLDQEGHSKAVYSIAFQCDGSICATGAMDHTIKMWDMRSGNCITTFEGHVNDVLCLDWSPNGYEFCSGSSDHTVKIWDLRRRRCAATIPAHTNIVTGVMFEKNYGHFVASCSFDNTLKMWSVSKLGKWALLCVMPSGHENKVAAMDMDRESSIIVTASHDRTWKTWVNQKNKVRKEKKENEKHISIASQIKIERNIIKRDDLSFNFNEDVIMDE